MIAGPVLRGAFQLAASPLAPAALTSGAPGRPGGSSTSVTATATTMRPAPPLPSAAVTVTTKRFRDASKSSAAPRPTAS